MSNFHPIETYCAYHEAGHAVAQVHYFGGGLKKVTLPPFDPDRADQYGAHTTLGFGDFPAPARMSVATRLEHVVLVLLAGAAAARRWTLDNGEVITNPGDGEDRALAAGLLMWAPNNGIHVDEKLLPGLERRITALFKRADVWRAVQKTVGPLIALREIRGDVLTCHVKLELGRRLSSVEIALMASLRDTP